VFWWNGYPGAVWQACSLIFEALEPVADVCWGVCVLAIVFGMSAEGCSSH
jgi:hypothetical protein